MPRTCSNFLSVNSVVGNPMNRGPVSNSARLVSSFGQQMRPRQQQRVEHGLGSGVIISPDGYIVTNNHVVDGAIDVRVTMSDRSILPAKVVGTDPLTDLAVIKVEGHDLPNAPWGDSTKLHPGTDGAGIR